jgi:hypothetical protein
MSDAARRVQRAARDARSNDDLVDEDLWTEEPLDSPIDKETFDERASTQMGEMWEPRRRDAN